MSPDDDRVEIDLPFIRFYAGSRGVHLASSDDDGVIDMDMEDEAEYKYVRQIVRRKLRFVRHLFVYLVVNAFFVLVDWQTGGSGNGVSWSIWVAVIWGAFVAWEFVSTFVAPHLWGRDMEERLIQRELRRRRDS
jgi:hypothetical protein